ncbi:hypothetical protein BpHYR1_052755 [Brachionus plicatilis]|uniref:DUF4419 domain-containing protein n=1 Tax=Brachionus plicatilis TaxID=10195 RepID=A0A3M7PRC3_BRAPC|nr:hypothetical protein BpHYR1_052755 [Brachionus plicatilis]
MKILKPNNIKIEQLPSNTNYVTPKEAVMKLVKVSTEHVQHVKSELDENLLESTFHPFVHAVHTAYSSHLPLIITPDIIWYLISSAVSVHINKNSEKLRSKFVDHEGKKKIKIRRDDFVLNSPTNPWNEVIDDFSTKIGELTKNDVADTLVASFTTTTKCSRVVSQIVLMDAMQKYFEYQFLTMCGIPEIRIQGDKNDWENLRAKTLKIIDLIPEFKQWYNNGLELILSNFISIFSNKVDNDFWNHIYKISGGSGGPFITGWINALFPYLNNENPNPYVWNKSWKDDDGCFSGLTTSSFEYHMNQVPFVWNYLNSEIEMLFIGGLIGVVHHKDQALQASFGYAVTEDKIKAGKQFGH